jgi:Lon protease-like protein
MAQAPTSGGVPIGSFFEGVPLFPLPNLVLFPRAVLPLHIFEERYMAMTADALRGRRQVAMALLQRGWEKNYYATPVIDPVVCIGQILSHEQLPDGKYNFLLQGIARARVVQEYGDKPYRVADLKILPETPVIELDMTEQRRRMTETLQEDFAAFLPGAQQFMQMLAGPLPTAAIADLIAFHLLDDVPFKQSLLADGDVRRRVTNIVEALRQLHPRQPISRARFSGDPSCN